MDHVRQLAQEGARVVARGGEFLVGPVGAFRVGRLGADGLDDVGVREVGGVGLGGVRVRARGADVVDVEIVGGVAAVGFGGGQGALDGVVAGIVGGGAVGVGARGLALGERGGAVGGVGVEVGGMLRGGDEGFVGVGVREVDIGLLLQGRVEPTVVDAQSDELDLLAFDGAGGDFGVLGFEVVGELGAVVTAVGFGEDAEVAVFILGELGVESLDEGPDVGSGSDCGSNLIVAV